MSGMDILEINISLLRDQPHSTNDVRKSIMCLRRAEERPPFKRQLRKDLNVEVEGGAPGPLTIQSETELERQQAP